MDVALWIAQLVLGAAFLGAGVSKLVQSHEKLGEQLGWPGDFSLGFVRFVGNVETLGGLGLILPRSDRDRHRSDPPWRRPASR
jgi:uncharacterized membrane protein YphA (DoxX/SURF4 family)